MSTESFAWSNNNIGIVKEAMEEVPGVLVIRGRNPDVRRMLATIDSKTHCCKALTDVCGIGHIMSNNVVYLTLTFR